MMPRGSTVACQSRILLKQAKERQKPYEKKGNERQQALCDMVFSPNRCFGIYGDA